MILHSYIKQYGVFGLSNITPILRISMTDYPNLIRTVEGTSSYIAFRWPRYVEFVLPTQQ